MRLLPGGGSLRRMVLVGTASWGCCCSPTLTGPALSLRAGLSSRAPRALPLTRPLPSGPCPAPSLSPPLSQAFPPHGASTVLQGAGWSPPALAAILTAGLLP